MKSSILISSSKATNALLRLSLEAISQCRAIIWYPGFKGTTAKFQA